MNSGVVNQTAQPGQPPGQPHCLPHCLPHCWPAARPTARPAARPAVRQAMRLPCTATRNTIVISQLAHLYILITHYFPFISYIFKTTYGNTQHNCNFTIGSFVYLNNALFSIYILYLQNDLPYSTHFHSMLKLSTLPPFDVL